jgi:uncharacterized protein (DUF849 family)
MASPSTSEGVIITCAITGSIHTPTMSEHLPITPEEIASSALEAADAGAAILHLHARDPESGRPANAPELFRRILEPIKAGTDAVANVSTGGSARMSLEQRLEAPLAVEPEMCSLNMGSMNFALFPVLDRPVEWAHDWEPEYLEATRGGIFKNTFEDMERILELLGRQRGARFEFECYDVGHVHSLRHLVDRGLVEGPLFIQFVMGVLGGIASQVDHLVHLKQTADNLFGDGYEFSVMAAGRAQMRLATTAAILGGNVRVGLEDSLYLERGRMARTNAEQVVRIREVLERLSFEIATPADARRRLGLKGAEAVSF